jgi:hypothetical protein
MAKQTTRVAGDYVAADLNLSMCKWMFLSVFFLGEEQQTGVVFALGLFFGVLPWSTIRSVVDWMRRMAASISVWVGVARTNHMFRE